MNILINKILYLDQEPLELAVRLDMQGMGKGRGTVRLEADNKDIDIEDIALQEQQVELLAVELLEWHSDQIANISRTSIDVLPEIT